MERRVRGELGFDRETRRYCMALFKFLQNLSVQGVFSDITIFSMVFRGEPESTPGTTRVRIDVEIEILVQDTNAVRVLFRALRVFSEWKCMK